MRRRDFTAGVLLAVAAPLKAAMTQALGDQRRIALVDTSVPAAELTAAAGPLIVRRFLEALRSRGHIEGRNLLVERYSAEGQPDRWVELADTVVSRKPDVIVTNFGMLARVLKNSTATIPIVVVMPDPIGIGIATGLAQPGGNATVVSFDAGPEIYGKQLQLLKEAVPAAANVACLASRIGWNFVVGPPWKDAARRLEMSLIPIVTSEGTSQEIRRALGEMARERPDGMIVSVDVDLLAHRRLIAEAAVKGRLPSVYPFRDYADLGGLMAYGPDLAELGQRLADAVHRILNGTTPGDIPIYQPTKFELVLNQRAAQALGLVFPPSLLARADEVIE